jgi:hypothetical protein
MIEKVIVIGVMVIILLSLGSALLYLVKDMGKGTRVVKALTIRIAISLTLFILLIVSFAMGWIHPHPLS